MGSLIRGLMLLVPIVATAAGYGRAGMPTSGQCESAYTAVDPDSRSVDQYLFSLYILEKNKLIRERYEGVYGSRACCEQVRGAVAWLVARVKDPAIIALDAACR